MLGFRRGLELATEACLAHSDPGDLWLDVGAGRGPLAQRLGTRARRVIATDADLAMLRPGTSRICADARALPIASRAVDGVAAVSFLGCVPDPLSFFAECARVLVPGGALVCTHSNRASLLLHASRLLRGRTAAGAPVRGRLWTHAPGSIESALRRAGFDPVARTTYHFVLEVGRTVIPPATLRDRWERRGAGGAGSWLGRSTLLVARLR
jgi:ubiquinone/menaquinone biosynthesis C-methylase UbiE